MPHLSIHNLIYNHYKYPVYHMNNRAELNFHSYFFFFFGGVFCCFSGRFIIFLYIRYNFCQNVNQSVKNLSIPFSVCNSQVLNINQF